MRHCPAILAALAGLALAEPVSGQQYAPPGQPSGQPPCQTLPWKNEAEHSQLCSGFRDDNACLGVYNSCRAKLGGNAPWGDIVKCADQGRPATTTSGAPTTQSNAPTASHSAPTASYPGPLKPPRGRPFFRWMTQAQYNRLCLGFGSNWACMNAYSSCRSSYRGKRIVSWYDIVKCVDRRRPRPRRTQRPTATIRPGSPSATTSDSPLPTIPAGPSSIPSVQPTITGETTTSSTSPSTTNGPVPTSGSPPIQSSSSISSTDPSPSNATQSSSPLSSTSTTKPSSSATTSSSSTSLTNPSSSIATQSSGSVSSTNTTKPSSSATTNSEPIFSTRPSSLSTSTTKPSSTVSTSKSSTSQTTSSSTTTSNNPAPTKGPYAITGVPVQSGALPVRRDINQLQAEQGPQWDLYIQALIEMYNTPSSDAISYFQIGGIHGKPYIEWNNTGPGLSNGWMGYCPHGEPLFLSWHRAYVVLFEQVLVTHAKRIASGYPGQYRAQYMQAAETLRAPFWDWAANHQVPQATVPLTVQINVPGNGGVQKRTVQNPLQTFKFPKEALDGAYGDFDSRRRPQTSRCSNATLKYQYPESANKLLSQGSYKADTYFVLTHSTSFVEFGSTFASGMSLEQLHNSIHINAACGEQFLETSFAGFDPLFMLHHTNVDRIWAYWQAIRPDQGDFTQSYKGGSRFSTPEGATITRNSPIAPFFGVGGKPHTPETMKSIQAYGYTYPGLSYGQKSEAEIAQDATTLINQLYRSSKLPAKAKRNMRRATMHTESSVQIRIELSDVPRPCFINIYANGTNAGRMALLAQPDSGIANGAVPLEGSPSQAVIQVEILKPDDTVIPLSSVPSLKLEIEDVDVIPPETQSDLPKLQNSRRRPVTVQARSRR